MLRRLEFTRDRHAPFAARRAFDEHYAEVLDGDACSDARLLISELVTNSVRHGQGGRIVVIVDAEIPGRLRCEVIDEGDGFVPRGRHDGPGGWGLDLVEQLATTWGVREGSTHVWFELPLAGSAGA